MNAVDTLLSLRCSGSTFCCIAKQFERGLLFIVSRHHRLPQHITLQLSHYSSRPRIRRLLHTPPLRQTNTANNSDPFWCVRGELDGLADTIRESLSSPHAEVVSAVASHYFQGGGKLMRPTMVLAMSGLCNESACSSSAAPSASQERVAAVAEMIHTASLIHDDVIDEAAVRRQRPSVNALHGNKQAILTGDYILAKATQVLARIGNAEVIALLAQVIEDLVKGEFMQQLPFDSDLEQATARLDRYLLKTFLKTASLCAHSCQAVALLGRCTPEMQRLAFDYGRHVGLAFQLIDDVLDYVGDSSTMGKEAIADLRQGVATAPVLIAAQRYPELERLIERRFSHDGDVETTLDYVRRSDGVAQTGQLAVRHSDQAVQCMEQFGQNAYASALRHLAKTVVDRDR